ncbi:hypothetical protein M0G74_01565 [Microbulbifer sp. CAU 1566]|uniref:hypothetical protein n=1 Tax=Microbulbifer sp. CAU 1566 TaxID=2933269 RepID=UPI0020031B8C|nr:hypothetical protein [Microbulbifer sp. CAU 1566]MCK7595953.1 hypothetical protein [Microbulbifer sp. CAU 1566]
MTRQLITFAFISAALLGGYWSGFWPTAADGVPFIGSGQSSQKADAIAKQSPSSSPVQSSDQQPAQPKTASKEPQETEPSAVTSLRQTMAAGDPRMPPLAPRPSDRVAPTTQELADHKLYQAYEARQQQQVYASFAAASAKKIADLKDMIALGRQGGVSPEQLAEGKRKLERLQKQRAQLLEQHPQPAGEEPQNQVQQ